jgi:glycosyltransferase involved in cell wall biosynthesis
MRKALEEHGDEVIPIDRLHAPFSAICALKKRFYRRCLKLRYDPMRDPLTLRSWANQVDERLATCDPDCAIGPGSLPFAQLRSRVPTAIWTDCVFAAVRDSYPEFSHLCAETLRDGNAAEQASLTRTSLAIYASDWARQTAQSYYAVDQAKLHVVPFGANIDVRCGPADVEELVRLRRDRGDVRLLFVGVDWHRKGGAAALSAAETLKRRGYNVLLDIVGCEAPVAVPPYVKVHGFVSKRTAEGRALLDELFRNASFLLLPSHAECFGIVLVEASSYGVPSLAANVGGIPTIIEPGVNGFLLPAGASGEDYATMIERGIAPDTYGALAQAAFQRFQTRFNWTVAGRRVLALLREYRGKLEMRKGPVPRKLAA